MTVSFVYVWASSGHLPDALDTLRERVEHHLNNGCTLLGGASLACDEEKFYVMQTLIKKED